MTEDKFDLSRRKVLGSLGVVGTGAVLGGAGTAALFNDEERSDSNTMEAGTLDLTMDWEYTANQDVDVAGTQEGSGGAGASFHIGDLKPGDDGTVTVNFTPESNPAWIWLKMEQSADKEGQVTEPEEEAEGGDVGTEGELDEEMRASVEYENGDVIQGRGTLEGVLDSLSSGVLLDSDRTNSSDDYFSADHEESVVVNWDIPSSVGNVIQGDIAKFDIVLYAEQARHNDNPQNPF